MRMGVFRPSSSLRRNAVHINDDIAAALSNQPALFEMLGDRVNISAIISLVVTPKIHHS
jgi:hypothetical protein